MSDDKKPDLDAKAKMLEALAKKQKGGNSGKAGGPSSGSKIGAGQTGGAAPPVWPAPIFEPLLGPPALPLLPPFCFLASASSIFAFGSLLSFLEVSSLI